MSESLIADHFWDEYYAARHSKDKGRIEAARLAVEKVGREIGAVEGTEGLRRLLREALDLVAYVSRHAASRNHDWSSACDGCNPTQRDPGE